MRGHGPLKRPQHQHARLSTHWFFVQHVETDPVVFQHSFVQKLDHLPHQIFDRAGGLIEAVDLLPGLLRSWEQ